MSYVKSAVMVPHPPLILPRIGKGEEKHIQEIIDAYKQAAKTIVDEKPDTVIIISPHAPSYYDYMQLSSGESGKGSMAQFGDYEDQFEIQYDTQMVDEISRLADEAGIPAGTLGQQDGTLDHGTMVPLYFLKDLPENTKFIRIGVAGIDNRMHYMLGQLIARAAKDLGRKVAIVASGDLSHCQKAGTHYGYKECGPAYDKKIMDIMSRAAFDELLQISEQEAQDAMVCGQKPFCVMAGALDGLKPETKSLAHSAFFGVGYGVITYNDLNPDASRDFGRQAQEQLNEETRKRMEKEDPWVALARKAINAAILEQEILEVPADLPEELLNTQAGAFVSIHEDGALRGCIGTTEPTRDSLAKEIIFNAIAASTRDPRFPAIAPYELNNLEINVDVLNKAEPIHSIDDLDVKKYGVIVTKDDHRGLLLPDLEGVDTVEKQLSIAKQKAGLSPDEPDCVIERFEVVRHR
ncbi:AmmeMemoRadiSam system protein A [Ileibacterium valens]|uniref:AmmeMemoRadiSam system protein A n=1 Tax=Ileibacterium valens TaxID=1862668 RepID=UPI0024BA46E8|nr:AmmeMemoRadiSam system protein A [Ileibacterium valens]